MTAIAASPLQWPIDWLRTPTTERASARFGKAVQRAGCVRPDGTRSTYSTKGELSIADGVARVQTELGRLGVDNDDVVISSNLQLRLDGLPRSAQAEPRDPGVAVYWRDPRAPGGAPRCIAIDLYDRVADNLAAIAATLDAMRAIARHGGAQVGDKAFTGFTALEDRRTPWWSVLGVEPDASLADMETAYRRRRSQTHPDRGGSADDFEAVQRANDDARRAHGVAP